MRPTALCLSLMLSGFLMGASWRAPWHWPLYLAGAGMLAIGCWLLVEAISERRELLRAVEQNARLRDALVALCEHDANADELVDAVLAEPHPPGGSRP